jgi:hypothetical protein
MAQQVKLLTYIPCALTSAPKKTFAVGHIGRIYERGFNRKSVIHFHAPLGAQRAHTEPLRNKLSEFFIDKYQLYEIYKIP